jgi:phenylacetate-coenzyme A ligase PaaK-like adenylate-forming protein
MAATTTTTDTSSWERFRTATQADVLTDVPQHVQRLGWSAGRIEAAQREGLRRLLAHAAEHSPFHRRRLGGVDIDRVDPADLSSLPVMTKPEMMAELDDVFTDRRLDRSVIDETLAATGAEPVPIHGDYIAMASGGSSGERGVFVFDRPAVAGFFSALSRSLMARLQALGGPPPGGLPIVLVAAASAVHATGVAPALTAGTGMPFRFTPVPATLPLAEIVARLNALQPPALFGYPSVLAQLAAEQQAGRLHVTPLVISSTSETLLAEARAAISDAFSVPVVDTFGSTEGLVGSSAPGDSVLVFNTDMCIVELVDDDCHPVSAGVPSTRVLVTNLYNMIQPLIRYELTDSFVRQPDAAEHGHLRARVRGRTEEVLHYDEIDIHPLAVRSVMVKAREVVDYQVRQTPRGVEVDAVTAGAADVDRLSGLLAHALADAGLTEPDVTVRIVDSLRRHHETGKVRRFVPADALGQGIGRT